MKKIGCFIFTLLLICGSLLPVSASEFPKVKSKYVYVYNLDENRVLYEKNSHKKMYPASMTKMMTVLTALDEIKDMDEVIVFTPEMLEGLSEEGASVVGYQVGNEARVIDLLYGILLPSGADASRAIAIHLYGSEEAFVKKMNEKAKALNLENTHFMNTSGLHDKDHYSTAADMAKILETGLKNTTFKKIFTTESYVIGSNKKDNTLATSLEGTTLESTKLNLMRNAGIEKDIIKGSKTGYTLEGGLCMASIADHDKAHYLIVTGNAGTDAGSAQNMKDAYTLYNYLFKNYERKLIYPKHKDIAEADLRFGESDKVAIQSKNDIYLLMEKGDTEFKADFAQSIDKAPIEKGEIIGTMEITYQDDVRLSFDVIASQQVDWSIIAFLSFFLFDCFLIIPLAIIIAILIMLYRKKTKRYRRHRPHRRRC